MLFEQLVTTVAARMVEVQGLSPNLDQDLMYRLMNMAPACADLEDHYLPAYTCLCVQNRFVAGRSYFKGCATAQSNYIIGPGDQLPNFKNNPALFTFLANAEGIMHDKLQYCPTLPELDYEHGASRFAPVFASPTFSELAETVIETIEHDGRVAVVGIQKPFRFLIHLYNMVPEDQRSRLSCRVNSSYLPKDEEIKLFVFPSSSSSLLKKLEAAEIRVIGADDLVRA